MKDDSNGICEIPVPEGTNHIYTAEVTLNPSENFGETWTFTDPNDKVKTIYTGLEYQFYPTVPRPPPSEPQKYSADTLVIRLKLPADWIFCLPDCFIRNQSKGPILQICKANKNHLWLEVNNPYVSDPSLPPPNPPKLNYGLQFLVFNTKDQHFYLSTDPQVIVTKLPPLPND